jgi:hypothetical protein
VSDFLQNDLLAQASANNQAGPNTKPDPDLKVRTALTEKQIRRGAHRSVRELETAIRSYLEITNQSPKPFVWTKTADEILASVARFCARTSGSGH